MERPQFTAWITKYALSTGISEEVVEFFNPGEMVKVVGGTWANFFHTEGVEWHRTRAAAVQRAEAMRLGKIEYLKKRLAKLEKLRFE